MRRKWIPIGLIVGLLAAAITGSAVLASEDDPPGSNGDAVTDVVVTDDDVTAVSTGNTVMETEEPDELAARIAEILGTDPQTTADAMAQVDAAMYAGYVDALLRKAVESGRITEEQANDIRAQVQSGDHTALDSLWVYSYEKRDSDSSFEEEEAEGISYQEYGNRIGAILGVDGQRVAHAIAQAFEELYAVEREIWDNGSGRDKEDKEESDKHPTESVAAS